MRAHGLARLRLLLSILLLALVGSSPLRPAFAQAPAGGEVRILHRVDWIAASRYTATVMITNMTQAPIDRWTMEFDLFPIADVMNNVAWSTNGSRHTVRGTGPMRTIEAGQMAWFTYEAEWTGSGVVTPAACRFNGAGCTIEPLVPPTPNPHVELPVEIVHWVSWTGLTQYRAQIWIHNISDEPIDFWTLGFLSDATITGIEHVSWSSSGSFYSVAGSGWTRRIEPDGAVWLTLEGVHTGEVVDPTACVFNGFECEFLDPEDIKTEEEPEEPVRSYCQMSVDEVASADPEDVSIRFMWNTLWATGYTAAIEITNLATDRPVRNWKLIFEMASTITVTRFWNGDLTKSGNRYTVSALLYNNCLEPGVTVTFGFEGAHNGAPTKPTVCEFGGEACTFSARFGSTGVEADDAVSPTGFTLEAAYPNPFSGRTRIPIRAERTQHVDVSVWDLQGRRVSTLYDGLIVAGDQRELSLEGHDLAPGAYLVRLTGQDGASVSRPLMRVR